MQLNCTVDSGLELVKLQALHQRPSLQGLNEGIFPCGGPNTGTLIEICGNSNTGKTLLLGHIVAQCLAPQSAGGRAAEVVLIDNDHHFSIKKVMQFVQHMLGGEDKSTESRKLLQQSLNGLQIIPCYTALESTISFDQVEDLLTNNKKIGLVAIDGFDSFYWEHNYHERQSKSTHFRNNLNKLRKLCDTFKVNIAYTIDDKLMLNENLLNADSQNASASNNYIPKAEYTLHMRISEEKIMLNERQVIVHKNYLEINN